MMQQPKPTSTDKEVFNYIQQAGEITSMDMYEVFNITSHRDVIYRLRKGGYVIGSEMIRYKKDGKMKCYCRYFKAA